MAIFRSGNLGRELAPLKCQGKTMKKITDIAKCKELKGGGLPAFEQNPSLARKASQIRITPIELNHKINLNDPYYPKKPGVDPSQLTQLNSSLLTKLQPKFSNLL